MLKNAYFLAKIGADTAENEQHYAEILPIGSRQRCRAADCQLGGELVLARHRELLLQDGLGEVSARAPRAPS